MDTYKYYDQHVHNHFSTDSRESSENYILLAKKLGIDAVYFTNHLDIDIDPLTHLSWLIDFDKENEEYKILQDKYPDVFIRKGIEVGYNPYKIDEIINIIQSQTFNVVNLSLHYWDGIDFYYTSEFEGRINELLDVYFDAQIDMANSNMDYDVFAHIDYGFKTAYLLDNSLKLNQYENKLIQILKQVIAHNKVLEINTKVQETINDESHVRYLLRLYKSLGGTLLTLSSDAHNTDRFRSSFDKYIKIIKSEGFDNLVYFINRKKYLYNLNK